MSIDKVVHRDGTSQQQRVVAALSPESVAMEERDTRYWIEFIREYTQLLNFYDEKNIVAGDWSGLLEDFTTDELIAFTKKPQQFLQQSGNVENFCQPHVALLLTFLHLLRYPQQQFKQLTQRHLDFYYQQVLKLTNKPAEPDHVYVSFELAPGKKQHYLKKGTLLTAGKDRLGTPLCYALDQDVDLNAAKIGTIKTIFIDQDEPGALVKGIYASTVYDQVGKKPLPQQGFPLFGSTQLDAGDELNQYLGLAIASPLLHLESGQREITLILCCLPYGLYQHKENIKNLLSKEKIFSAFFTGIEQPQLPKEWSISDLRFETKVEPESLLGGIELYPLLMASYSYGEVFDYGKELNLDFSVDAIGKLLLCPLQKDGKQSHIYLVIAPKQLVYLGKADSPQSSNDEVQLYSYNAAYYDLTFNFNLAATQPAITTLPGDLLKNRFNISKDYPTLTLLLKTTPDNEEQACYYTFFSHIYIAKITLDVSVNGLENFTIGNDAYLLSSRQPFDLFGPQPTVGSGFYIAHQEFCEKDLNSLSMQFDWVKCPKDFNAYYENYGQQPEITNESFLAKLIQASNGKQEPLLASVQLFTPPDKTSIDNYLEKSLVAFSWDLKSTAISTNKPAIVHSNNPVDYPVYYKIELQGTDFQHQDYPRRLMEISLENTVKIKGDGKDLITLNPPYTPMVKQLSISYAASASWTPQESFIGTVAHIYPFGWKSNDPFNPFDSEDASSDGYHVLDESEESSSSVNNSGFAVYQLLPNFNRQGYLLIGVENSQPVQNLSLFFKLGMRKQENLLSWYQLVDNTWQKIKPGQQLLADGTTGLSNTGVSQFSLDTAGSNNSLLPADHYWLMASIKEQKKQKGRCYVIATNAAEAVFVNTPKNLSRELALLPPNTIKGLLKYDSAIKNIIQFDYSFLGRLAEKPFKFNIRVSERLRHKQRALTAWDYEHLILEQFPEIYKVKCFLDSSGTQALGTSQPKIILVIIPRREFSVHPNTLKPETPRWLLQRIKEYMQSYVSPFVVVEAKNPNYQSVECHLTIYLNDLEKMYYRQVVNEQIIRYLSPWKYEDQVDICFCSHIYASPIIEHVEALPFVNHVKDFRFSYENNDNYADTIVEISEPDTILVSGSEHYITFITQENK